MIIPHSSASIASDMVRTGQKLISACSCSYPRVLTGMEIEHRVYCMPASNQLGGIVDISTGSLLRFLPASGLHDPTLCFATKGRTG